MAFAKGTEQAKVWRLEEDKTGRREGVFYWLQPRSLQWCARISLQELVVKFPGILIATC